MGTEVALIPYAQIERMAQAVAKSGMFAVKTPEAALTLMLVAQAENVHPAQAMMDYDLIQGKPALKSAAMLARFQRSGGKVRWITSTDAVASAEFTHPAGGSLVVTWDEARLQVAGLAGKEMHKKFPAQMKRARCIGEGVRAIAPQCIPVGMYTTEETQDIEVDVTPAQRIENAVEAAAHATTVLTMEEMAEHEQALRNAETLPALQDAYSKAMKHASESKDSHAKAFFVQWKDARKAELATAVEAL